MERTVFSRDKQVYTCTALSLTHPAISDNKRVSKGIL